MKLNSKKSNLISLIWRCNTSDRWRAKSTRWRARLKPEKAAVKLTIRIFTTLSKSMTTVEAKKRKITAGTLTNNQLPAMPQSWLASWAVTLSENQLNSNLTMSFSQNIDLYILFHITFFSMLLHFWPWVKQNASN